MRVGARRIVKQRIIGMQWISVVPRSTKSVSMSKQWQPFAHHTTHSSKLLSHKKGIFLYVAPERSFSTKIHLLNNLEGLNKEQFIEVCTSDKSLGMGTDEAEALFVSLDRNGDGLLQVEEIVDRVPNEILRERFVNFKLRIQADEPLRKRFHKLSRSGRLARIHPVWGAYQSLPRPPFRDDPQQEPV